MTIRNSTSNKLIEQLRSHLEQTFVEKGDLLHPDVIRASQDLDRHLVKMFERQYGIRPQSSYNVVPGGE